MIKAEPHPSPRQYPSAEASKAALRHYEDNIFAWQVDKNESGNSMQVTPCTKLTMHQRLNKYPKAIFIATNEPEHAVSIDMLGPVTPQTKDTRFAAIAGDKPTAA